MSNELTPQQRFEERIKAKLRDDIGDLLPDDVLPSSLRQSTLAGADTFVLDGPWQDSGTMVAAAVGHRPHPSITSSLRRRCRSSHATRR